MIKTIAIYFGSPVREHAIESFFCEAEEILLQSGVVGISIPKYEIADECSPDTMDEFLRDEIACAPLRDALEPAVQKSLANPTIDTLGIVQRLHKGQTVRLPVLVALLRQYFPAAKITCFAFFPLPEKAVEGAYYYETWRKLYHAPLFTRHVMNKIVPVNEVLHHCVALDGCGLVCVQDGLEYSKYAILSALFESLSIPVTGNPTLDSYKHKKALFPWPKRDTVQFMAYTNTAFPDTQTALPWIEEENFLVGGTDEGMLLSPDLKNELWERYLLRDQRYPQHVNPKEYFAEARKRVDALYADWQPPAPLAWEGAVRLAKLLSPEFVEKILDGPILPDENLRKGTRLCLDAIRAAHRGGSRPRVSTPPKVSVLTASYNHAAFIEDTIKSVLEQNTNFPVEHIIADDGSDDGTQDIIMEYAGKYPSIKPILRKKRGAGNFLVLFEGVESPYAALCDGDDYFTDPNKLQIQADFLDTHQDCALCFHVVRVLYEDDPERVLFYPPLDELPRGVRQFYYLSALIKCNFIQTNSVMYRWRFPKGLPDWFRTNICPGDWYWHLLHAELGKIGFINKEMSVYRRHKGGVYYTAEVDRLKHRFLTGRAEIEAYDATNRHFKGRFFEILADLADGVIADTTMYLRRTPDCGQTMEQYYEQLAQTYPRFMLHFLQRMQNVGKNA